MGNPIGQWDQNTLEQFILDTLVTRIPTPVPSIDNPLLARLDKSWLISGKKTKLGIPKYDADVDTQNVLGFNKAMDKIDTLISSLSAYKLVQDEGTPLTARTTLDFAGTGVTATDDAANSRTLVTVPSGIVTVQDEGTPLTARQIIDFAGTGVTATDDAGNSRTLVTIPGASGGSGFTTGARVFHSANQSILDSTTTVLAFDSERFDTDTIHDNVTNNTQLVCKTAGKYLIWGNATWAPSATGYRGAGFILNFGGTPGAFIDQTYIASSGSVVGTGHSIACVYSLAVNDVVEMYVRQTSGGALNIINGANYTPEFGMQRIG